MIWEAIAIGLVGGTAAVLMAWICAFVGVFIGMMIEEVIYAIAGRFWHV